MKTNLATEEKALDEEMSPVMPSIETVCEYAKPNIWKFISKYADDFPHEQKEEIVQEVYIRLIKAYPGIDPSKGWKSFVYNHCRGGVMDYAKAGNGFEGDVWTI